MTFVAEFNFYAALKESKLPATEDNIGLLYPAYLESKRREAGRAWP